MIWFLFSSFLYIWNFDLFILFLSFFVCCGSLLLLLSFFVQKFNFKEIRHIVNETFVILFFFYQSDRLILFNLFQIQVHFFKVSPIVKKTKQNKNKIEKKMSEKINHYKHWNLRFSNQIISLSKKKKSFCSLQLDFVVAWLLFRVFFILVFDDVNNFVFISFIFK